MIKHALLHCPQIGPARLKKLHASELRTWEDVLQREHELPSGIRAPIVAEVQRCMAALEAHDIRYFVDNLATQDRWRILAHFLDDVTFFDIETAGLEYDDPITMIACWHRGEVHHFVEHENLDDFLELLDDVRLLSSFNGSTFDVPRVLDSFHIPALPCPHLDLRWLCFHQDLRGGLKEIAFRLGISRPPDLQSADGEMAIRLWARWEHFQDAQAREDLIRYCVSDVLLLVVLANRLVGSDSMNAQDIWKSLPFSTGTAATTTTDPDDQSQQQPNAQAFGVGSPSRLRARRKRVG